jgi:hypothetical protein
VEDYGLRWQSAAATPLSHRDQTSITEAMPKSGVALRFPPHSKKVTSK